MPLYSERYFLLAPRAVVPDGATGIAWSRAADLPLCLLTPDMQNRRIADAAFRMAGRAVAPLMETNSMMTLYSLVRSGLGAGVVPGQLLTVVAAHPDLVALPLTDPDLTYAVGLVHADRDPPSPLASALAAVAAEDGLAQRLRALAEETQALWLR